MLWPLRSYRVAAHRRGRDRAWQGGSAPCSLSDNSGRRDRGLYPLAQGRRGAGGGITSVACRRRGRSLERKCFGRFAATGSPRIGAAAIELGRGALHRALSLTIPAGAIVVFIPWRRGAAARAAE